MQQKLLMATRNKNKKREMQQILSGLDVELMSLDDIDEIPEVIEDGHTFQENAIKKAFTTARLTGLLTLADDSGLVVDALEGQPGVYSARFAGPGADDAKNNEKLLLLLKNVEENRRTARFICVIALASPNGNIETVEGLCEGSIAFERSGESGFGYDPLFIPEGFQKSFAELGAEEKNRISHRGKALASAAPILKDLLTRS